MRLKHRSVPVLICVALLLAVVGIARAGEVVYSARPYDSRGVVIQAEQIFLKKDKLWLRLRVINNTGKLLTIDKSQIQARLNGGLINRAEGVFGKYAKPHILNAGLSHALNIEFVIGQVPMPVELVLKQGFIVDGKSLPLADYPVTPAGAR